MVKMTTLTMGGVTHEIVDEAAREDIEILKEDIASLDKVTKQLDKDVKSVTGTFGDAIKNKVEGNVIAMDDVSSVEHELKVKVTCPDGVNPTTVNVRRCGKNLIDVENIEVSNYTGYYYEIITDFEPKIGEMYVLSVDVECDTFPSSVSIGCGSNGFQGELVPYVAQEFSENGKIVVPFVWNLPTHNQESGETKLAIRIPRYLESKTFNAKAYNFQLEIGDTATTYEPYKSTEHTPTTNGTISGMMSTSPNMTILTDTEGVVIDCEYNVDTKTYIDKKFAELQALIQ